MSDELIKKLFVPIIKTCKTDSKINKEYGFTGILSDDSLDRDDEMMSPELLKEWAKKGSIPGIMNHENKIENYVADFNNLRTIKEGGRTILVGDIEFFDVPEAKSVKLKVIKGKHVGLSISAIPQDYAMIKKEVRGKDKEVKMFTKGELLEGSFIPIPSNRFAQALAFAKSFDLNKSITEASEQLEVIEVEKEEIKKEITTEESKVEVKKPEDVKKEFDIEKAFSELNEKLSALEKKFEISKEVKEVIEPAKPEESAKVEKPDEAKNDVDVEKGVKKEALITAVPVVKIEKEVTLKDVVSKMYGGMK